MKVLHKSMSNYILLDSQKLAMLTKRKSDSLPNPEEMSFLSQIIRMIAVINHFSSLKICGQISPLFFMVSAWFLVSNEILALLP